MPVWKRYKGEKVKRGHKDYDKGTWVAEGKVDGESYKQALPRETIKTAEQARAKDDEIRAAIRSGEFEYAKDRTFFSAFVDTVFLPYWKTNKEGYRQKVSQCNRLKKFFGDEKLKSIKPSRCEEFKRWRQEQTVTCQKCRNKIEHECSPVPIQTSTVNRDLVTLHAILERARVDKKIKENPMDDVPLLGEPEARERYISDEERAKLWPVLMEPRNFQLYCFVVVALLAGWRKQQILHLRKTDLENGKVWVMKQKRRPRRLVRVHPLVWNILTVLAENREDWLFTNRKGERRADMKDAWWTALERAGIDNLRIHDLRHSFSTEMLDSGAGGFVINHALGHVKMETTEGYAHVKDEMLVRALEALKTDDIPRPDAILTPSEAVM